MDTWTLGHLDTWTLGHLGTWTAFAILAMFSTALSSALVLLSPAHSIKFVPVLFLSKLDQDGQHTVVKGTILPAEQVLKSVYQILTGQGKLCKCLILNFGGTFLVYNIGDQPLEG